MSPLRIPPFSVRRFLPALRTSFAVPFRLGRGGIPVGHPFPVLAKPGVLVATEKHKPGREHEADREPDDEYPALAHEGSRIPTRTALSFLSSCAVRNRSSRISRRILSCA